MCRKSILRSIYVLKSYTQIFSQKHITISIGKFYKEIPKKRLKIIIEFFIRL